MLFAHDTEMSLASAVQLVNSAEDPDTLTSVAALDEFYVAYRYTGRHESTAAELAEVRALRPQLRELLTSSRDDAVEIVNRMLREARTLPQLARHDGWDWHLHAIDPDRPFAERIVVETAMAMVDVIRADEMSRLSTCAADDCAGIVLDLSRNRSRKFCSTTCGNRTAVAAYRARQSS
ncbi:MAG TPA: CGNR zinc finger domain-containing protein [Nocardioides sp.]